MSQNLQVELTIPIPSDSVLIKKTEYDRLRESESRGQFETVNWLKKKTRIETLETLKEKILYPYRSELDVENGGFVFYPRKRGEPFSIMKIPMEKWLENNFRKIFS